MSWDGMFKKFSNKGKVAATYPTTEAKGGEVLPRTPLDAQERLDQLKAENERLSVQVREGWQHEYDRGYLDGLTKARNLVENADGRPGKRQAAEMFQNEIRKVLGVAED